MARPKAWGYIFVYRATTEQRAMSANFQFLRTSKYSEPSNAAQRMGRTDLQAGTAVAADTAGCRGGRATIQEQDTNVQGTRRTEKTRKPLQRLGVTGIQSTVVRHAGESTMAVCFEDALLQVLVFS
ncbi:hypothetical protein SPI_08412 [Niveomyces insectorum RCEF 264]|uniref:Uncharacterized protein n=1 Tax=Niveomyces insectorum RCEF 264 TaxID=1081102 RepID=A0A167NA97_9HYPO|nr:hypothetical protein SPI_08412 [Niveomyces insectorum RCEF 264]